MVNVLAIVYDPATKKILIGKRENDPYIKDLTWCFPGGRPEYDLDLEDYVKKEVSEKTGLEVSPQKVVFAKTYPEDRRFLSIYYYCEAAAGNEKADDKFVEISWIAPDKVTEYFTTSLHPKLLDYLKALAA